ncbi:TniQ family protein [Azospirillum argentinense]
MEIEDIPPAMVAPLRWPIRPPILPNELLSSWISRLALANGLSPASLHEDLHNLTGPTSSVSWTTAPPLSLVQYLAHHADQSAETILRSAPVVPSRLISREDFVGRLTAAFPKILLRPNRIATTAAGDLNREQAHLLYCPLCLLEDDEPNFRRTWRSRLVTGCDRHGVRLLHGCPKCGRDIAPHLSRHINGICFCGHCEADLREAVTVSLTEREAADSLDTLTFIESVLGRLPAGELGASGETLVRRAIAVASGATNFWHLFFAPNEIGGNLEWVRRPKTDWRDGMASEMGAERLAGKGAAWSMEMYGVDRIVPWNGETPAEIGTGRLIGYANRYSDGDPNLDKLLDMQIGALRLIGIADTAIYVDDAQLGVMEVRDGLRAALKTVQPGDTLVVLGLEFLGRSTPETMNTIQKLREIGAHLWMLDTQIHTASERGRMIFETVALLEAAQRRRHVSWSKAAILEAIHDGRHVPGRPTVPREKILEGGRMYLAGFTRDAIAERLGIGRSTVSKYKQEMLAAARSDLEDIA